MQPHYSQFGKVCSCLSVLIFMASGSRAFADKFNGRIKAIEVDDFKSGKSMVDHELFELDSTGKPTGRIFKLKFKNNPKKHFDSDSIVEVEGSAGGKEIALNGPENVATLVPAPQPGPMAGSRKVAVILVHFADSALSCTASTVNSLVFGPTDSVNASYLETSKALLGFSGDVFGPYTINAHSADACDYSGWGGLADIAAAQSGVDLSAYQHKQYMLPASSCSGASGWGEIGCSTQCRSWILTYCSSPGVSAHELGHNLGMNHASTAANEYGDYSDIMGNFWYMAGTLGQINSSHREQMGWIGAVPVVSSGSYALSALELDTGNAVKLLKSKTGGYLYLSYRSPIGVDANIPSNYFNVTSVHSWQPPMSNTYLVGTIADGQTFTDSTNGITITQTSHDSLSANIDVSVTIPCNRAAPSVIFSPATQMSTGGSANYTVSIKNNDSVGCPSSNFQFSQHVPLQWTSSLSQSSFDLISGNSVTTIFSVSPGISPANGTYALSMSAIDSMNSSHQGSGSGSFVLDTLAPTAPTGLAGSSPKRFAAKLVWAASSDLNGVAGYRVFRDGIMVNQVTTEIYTDKTTSALHSYEVRAVDPAGNISLPSASVVVRVK